MCAADDGDDPEMLHQDRLAFFRWVHVPGLGDDPLGTRYRWDGVHRLADGEGDQAVATAATN